MVWVLVGVGMATAVVAVVVVAALVRRLRALTESVAELQRALLPVLEDIRRGSDEAQQRMTRLQESGAALETGGR
jgi:TolA-binding protein